MQNNQIIRTQYMLPYITFWFAIAIVFEALFLLTPDIDFERAAIAGIQIIGIAAILGYGVLRFALITPMFHDDRNKCLILHTFGAFLYTALWIGSVSLTGALASLVMEGIFQMRFPGPAAFRWHLIAGPILYVAIVTAIFSVRSFERSQNLIRNAELKALRAKLNPHFVFNTLHTIMMLFRSDASKAEAAMEKFSDLIRYSFHGASSQNNKHRQVSLGDDWDMAKRYLDLEKMRLGGRLSVETEIDDKALLCRSPRLLLQPLIENAVIHGAAKREDQTNIIINIAIENEKIEISIVNDFIFNEDENGRGVGISAVKAGLENVFGADFSLNYGVVENGTFKVSVNLPVLQIGEI